MARGATGSGIVRKEGEKPEGREGKRGEQNDCEYGRRAGGCVLLK